MKYYAFEVFWWLPWLIIGIALAGVVLLIVLSIRARRRLWKILLALCVPVFMIASCAGLVFATFVHVPLANTPAPVPDSLSVSFMRYPTSSAAAVTALNARTGAVRWQHAIDGISRLSVADEHTIYLVSNQLQTIIAVRAGDAQERWRTPLTNSLDSQLPLRFLVPPIVADGMLFISGITASSDAAPGALVFALNTDTGALAWSVPIKEITPTAQTPLLTAGQGIVFVAMPTGNLVALRDSDGTQVWSAPGVTSEENLVVFTDGVVSFLQDQHIVALDAFDGKPLWSYPLDSQLTDVFPNPLGAGATSLYVSSNKRISSHGLIDNEYVGYLTSLNARTGNVQWKYQTSFEGSGQSVAEAGGLVYYVHGSYLDAIRTSDGHRVWRVSLTVNLGFGTPVIVHGVLYASSYVEYPHNIVLCSANCEPPTAIYALDATTGAVYWHSAWATIDTSVPPWVTSDSA